MTVKKISRWDFSVLASSWIEVMRSAFWSAENEALPQREALWSAESEALPQRKALWSAESEAKTHAKSQIFVPIFYII